MAPRMRLTGISRYKADIYPAYLRANRRGMPIMVIRLIIIRIVPFLI